MFVLYGLETCPHCKRAIVILQAIKRQYNISYKVYNMKNAREKEYYKKKNGMQTFPQIYFIKNREWIKIGGADDLERLVFR